MPIDSRVRVTVYLLPFEKGGADLTTEANV